MPYAKPRVYNRSREAALCPLTVSTAAKSFGEGPTPVSSASYMISPPSCNAMHALRNSVSSNSGSICRAERSTLLGHSRLK